MGLTQPWRVLSGSIDGAFIDGISSGSVFNRSLLSPANDSEKAAWLLGLNTTLADLRKATGDKAVLLQNSHSGWPRSRDARTQAGVGGKIDSKLSYGLGASLLSDMQLVADTSPRVAAIYQDFGYSDYKSFSDYNASIAAFLISMGPNAYWSYTRTLSVSPRAVWPNNVAGSWSCDNWAAVTGHEADYTRPLGAPKGPAMDCDSGGRCGRGFKSGTCAYLDTSNGSSCVWWADGHITGDDSCALPKPQACSGGHRRQLKQDDMGMCPDSPQQLCRMVCPETVCPAGQCAMRQGSCCDISCQTASRDDVNVSASSDDANIKHTGAKGS